VVAVNEKTYGPVSLDAILKYSAYRSVFATFCPTRNQPEGTESIVTAALQLRNENKMSPFAVLVGIENEASYGADNDETFTYVSTRGVKAIYLVTLIASTPI
jgi:hypothetical protein